MILSRLFLPGHYAFMLFNDTTLPYLQVWSEHGAGPLHPYVDLKYPDSWLTSHNCWTGFCLEEATNLTTYNGKVSEYHQSNGTIANITTSLQSHVMGLQATDALFRGEPGLKKGGYVLYNASFVEGYEINTIADAGAGGMLGFGTIYGVQTSLTPIPYGAYWSGQIEDPVFSLWWNSTQSYLFLGTPMFITLNNTAVCQNIPIAANDGTWNFLITELKFNNVIMGPTGLGVLDLLDPYITLPKSVGAIFATAIGATITEIDGVDYYNISCPTSSLPDINFVTLVGSIPLSASMYSYQIGSNCYVNIRGEDLYTPGDGFLYWSLGLPLLLNYYTSFNFTLGAETITFNLTTVVL